MLTFYTTSDGGGELRYSIYLMQKYSLFIPERKKSILPTGKETKSTSIPYQRCIKSVPSPCLQEQTWYGVGMDLTRSWYGLGYIRIRMKQKKCHALPFWLFGIMAIWQFLERGKGILTIRNINHTFYFNSKHKSIYFISI